MRWSAERPTGASCSSVVRPPWPVPGRQLALGIISLVAFIPISIVLGVNDQFLALLVTLAGIVAVNAAHAWQSRGD